MFEDMPPPSYDASLIKIMDWPPSMPAGPGWWRLGWSVQYGTTGALEGFHLPTPHSDSGDSHFVLGLLPITTGEFRIELLTRQEKMTDEEISYVSILLQELREWVGPLLVDGVQDHPILHLSKRPDK